MFVCCFLWFRNLAFIEKETHIISQCSPPFIVIFRILEVAPPPLEPPLLIPVCQVWLTWVACSSHGGVVRAARLQRVPADARGRGVLLPARLRVARRTLPRSVAHCLACCILYIDYRVSSLSNILSTFQTATSASGRARARSAAPTCSAPTSAPASTGIRCATTTNPALL